ncbi:MAG: tetratricopeptide repeat protein [Caldilineae bacterium]|nr:tetratricopeptide repeat protein [Anaerolineae bacterium]MCB0203918.1 tetratricopeptide repeat protein [Anaerolineae bacterium]MCB9154584.1 tetratricopeptide repeat protein [Caldilineae bacterium]
MADSADQWTSKDNTGTLTTAMARFQEGYELQLQGLWAEAMACYRESIRLHPTAEAHTFLGWVYSFLKLYDEAIAECRLAIEIDPEFGNPYNDIGAYLMELGRDDEAILWFHQAIRSVRYDARCYPLFNLGRIYERRGDWLQAIDYYRKAQRENPAYEMARLGRINLQARMN